jgi:capsid protein
MSRRGLQMSMLDRAIAAVAPVWGLSRAQARMVLAGVHEATKPSRSRKIARDGGNGAGIVDQDAATLRNIARHLERDHDLARGALNTLVQNVVGTGIDIEPAPRLPGKPVDQDLADQLNDLITNWWERPEVTWRHDAGSMQRLLGRSWLRDGESLAQDVQGYAPGLDHGSVVPYSIEMIEADQLPLGYTDVALGIRQGIETNAWGRPLAYHLYKGHPGDLPRSARWRPSACPPIACSTSR